MCLLAEASQIACPAGVEESWGSVSLAPPAPEALRAVGCLRAAASVSKNAGEELEWTVLHKGLEVQPSTLVHSPRPHHLTAKIMQSEGPLRWQGNSLASWKSHS